MREVVPDQASREMLRLPMERLLRRYPALPEFFDALQLPLPQKGSTPVGYFEALPDALLEEVGLARPLLAERFLGYLGLLEPRRGAGGCRIRSIAIGGGRDKSGNPEGHQLLVRPGEVVSIVGPTGSGKSRFLADIEWLAQGDTPTGRTLLINGSAPDPAWRFAPDRKLVAQLSQNMNFVIDLSVVDFVTMHAESRMVDAVPEAVARVIGLANELAGERFGPDTPVTALSGGQSRALMIADTSCLSSSPIVLIDEIENAGIDRKRAVRALVDQQKIVLMATHDPILALMADRRLVFRNGGIAEVIETSPAERANLERFEAMDARLNAVRNALRNGERIESGP